MDTKRNGTSRRSKHRSPTFRLRVFEDRLRAALNYTDASRGPGEPGSVRASVHLSTPEFAIAYLFEHLLKKYDDGKSSEAKAVAALDKFWQAEEICWNRNLFFSQEKQDVFDRYPALKRAQEWIRSLLGDSIDLNEVSRNFDFGPGASTRLPRKRGAKCYKYDVAPEVTSNAYPLAMLAIASNPYWKQYVQDFGEAQVVFGSRLTTVPKNYKVDRVIAVEPDLNMFLQKGLGGVLRRKLKKVGIDLDDQSINQRAASDKRNATIDFSMASDTVSQGVCHLLLPGDYADFIALTRSEFVVCPDKKLHRLSKVSSNGNGYTFELESLLFAALAFAIVPIQEHQSVHVYGDDVVIPAEYAEEYLELTSICGFVPNVEKSFWEGPFRESCGKHYHEGHDVSPFYIKAAVRTQRDLFLVHNNLHRWLHRVHYLLTETQRAAIEELLLDLRSFAAPKWRRRFIPDGFGDGAFVGAPSSLTLVRDPGGMEVYVFDSYVDVPNVDKKGRKFYPVLPFGAMVAALTRGKQPSAVNASHHRVFSKKLSSQKTWARRDSVSLNAHVSHSEMVDPLSVEPVVTSSWRPGKILIPWSSVRVA